MIHTAKQLKDKVKNMSGGNSEVDDLTWGEVSETIVDKIEKISFFSDQVS